MKLPLYLCCRKKKVIVMKIKLAMNKSDAPTAPAMTPIGMSMLLEIFLEGVKVTKNQCKSVEQNKLNLHSYNSQCIVIHQNSIFVRKRNMIA